MDITLIALAGVLLLGAGIAILVVNLGRNRGSNMTIEQIGTYGYVAESAGGSEVDGGRRPIDALAGRLGDLAAKRTSRGGEAKIRDELVSAACTTRARARSSATRSSSRSRSRCCLLPVPAMGGSIVFAVVLTAAVAVGWSRRLTTSTSRSASASRRSTGRCPT